MNCQPMSAGLAVANDCWTGGLAFLATESAGDVTMDGTDFVVLAWRAVGIGVPGVAVGTSSPFGVSGDTSGLLAAISLRTEPDSGSVIGADWCCATDCVVYSFK